MTPSIWTYVLIFLGPAIGLVLLIDQVWIFFARKRANLEAILSIGKGVRMMIITFFVGAVMVLCTAAVVVVEEVQALRDLFAGTSFTKSVKVTSPGEDRGYYYRFKAGLAYKGEPLDFDIVVGCNVRVTTSRDNDQTVEVGVAPMLYGLKMKDGRGVVVRAPEACQGETTENGKVPVSLLPLVVTYENADQPWLGLAYASEDAYASPISELKFFGATISKATREEWQDWRRTEAPKNFVTYELLGINRKNIWDHPHWKPGYRAMPSKCRGFSWVVLPEPVREAIRPYWPASKPQYWYPNGDAQRALRGVGNFDGYYDRRKQGMLFDGHPLYSYFGLPPNMPEVKFLSKNSAVGALYPARSDVSFNRLDGSGELSAEVKAKSRKSWADANIDPQLKGFAYCDLVDNIVGTPSAVSYVQLLDSRVNGEPISEEAVPPYHEWQFVFAFERDEYVFFSRTYPLVSLFGGL
ncbi:hypothetical protein [Bradyrhizobium uaiense]|uniref:Uncharacterized protein n=1 Tax=Bradyrhizobium uaiense TaxID=2594946 RepID=A0A6P1BGB2_9BRAD|nr:hypothetical protein [Bradyrhizobium uaiense]NEU97435.1 hypothetical protein [Bradyrhizobium uaiense]